MTDRMIVLQTLLHLSADRAELGLDPAKLAAKLLEAVGVKHADVKQ